MLLVITGVSLGAAIISVILPSRQILKNEIAQIMRMNWNWYNLRVLFQGKSIFLQSKLLVFFFEIKPLLPNLRLLRLRQLPTLALWDPRENRLDFLRRNLRAIWRVIEPVGFIACISYILSSVTATSLGKAELPTFVAAIAGAAAPSDVRCNSGVMGSRSYRAPYPWCGSEMRALWFAMT